MTSNQTAPKDDSFEKELQNLFGDAATNASLILIIFIGSGILGILFGYINMTFTASFVTFAVIPMSIIALVSFDRKIREPAIIWSFVAGFAFEIGRLIGFVIQIITHNVAATMLIFIIGLGIYIWKKKRDRD